MLSGMYLLCKFSFIPPVSSITKTSHPVLPSGPEGKYLPQVNGGTRDCSADWKSHLSGGDLAPLKESLTDPGG